MKSFVSNKVAKDAGFEFSVKIMKPDITIYAPIETMNS